MNKRPHRPVRTPITPSDRSLELIQKREQNADAHKEVVKQAGRLVPLVGYLHRRLQAEDVEPNMTLVKTETGSSRLGRVVLGKLTNARNPHVRVVDVKEIGKGWQIAGVPFLGGYEETSAPKNAAVLLESGQVAIGSHSMDTADELEFKGFLDFEQYPIHPSFTHHTGFVTTTGVCEAVRDGRIAFQTPESLVYENVEYLERSLQQAGRSLLGLTHKI